MEQLLLSLMVHCTAVTKTKQAVTASAAADGRYDSNFVAVLQLLRRLSVNVFLVSGQ